MNIVSTEIIKFNLRPKKYKNKMNKGSFWTRTYVLKE